MYCSPLMTAKTTSSAFSSGEGAVGSDSTASESGSEAPALARSTVRRAFAGTIAATPCGVCTKHDGECRLGCNMIRRSVRLNQRTPTQYLIRAQTQTTQTLSLSLSLGGSAHHSLTCKGLNTSNGNAVSSITPAASSAAARRCARGRGRLHIESVCQLSRHSINIPPCSHPWLKSAMCSGLCSPLLHCYPLHTVVIGGHPRDEDRKGRCASLYRAHRPSPAQNSCVYEIQGICTEYGEVDNTRWSCSLSHPERCSHCCTTVPTVRALFAHLTSSFHCSC